MKVTLADVNREVDKLTHIGKFSEILDIARKKARYNITRINIEED